MAASTGQYDRANAILFSSLCDTFERVAQESGATRKLQLLFPDALREHLQGQSAFPVVRLMLPQLDRERNSYGLKQAVMAKHYIANLGLQSSHPVAQRLRHYRDPNARDAASAGDFTTVLEEVLRLRTGPGEKMTVMDVNELANADTHPGKQAALNRALKDMSAREQKWLARVILKDLKIGLRHERALSYFHPDAMDLYNACTDLRRVVDELRDPRVRSAQRIELFLPFYPMLAKRKTWFRVSEAMGDAAFVIEPKLDGERILCHRSGTAVRFFTRNSTDYTPHYGPSVAPQVLELVAAKQCILDGEMLAWDEAEQRFVEFGHNKTVALGRAAGASRQWLCYMVFDILFMDGLPADVGAAVNARFPALAGSESGGRGGGGGGGGGSGGGSATGCLTGVPLRVRRDLLRLVVRSREKRLELVQGLVVPPGTADKRHEVVMRALDDCVSAKQEGVMLKQLDSPYVPGEAGRRTQQWVKLKPDYIEGLGETVDGIVLAAYYGEGTRRSGDISHFLVGVSAQPRSGDALPSAFLVFCKVGSGYTVEELQEVRAKLRPFCHKYDPSRPPAHFASWRPGKRSDIPDVWVEPSHSVLVEVKGFEITRTDQFSAGYTLRFPRVVRFRYDKDWHECTSMAEVAALAREAQAGRGIFKRRAVHMSAEEVVAAAQSSKRRRGKARGEGGEAAGGVASRGSGVVVLSEYQAADVTSVQREGDLLADKECCIIPGRFTAAEGGTESWTKPAMEALVAAHGGRVVQNPLPSTHFVLAASAAHMKVRNLAAANQRDVIHYEWLLDCVHDGTLAPPEPFQLLHATLATQERLSCMVDQYGDAFERPATEKSLRRVLAQVQAQCGELPPPDVADLTPPEAAALRNPLNPLRDCVLYVLCPVSIPKTERWEVEAAVVSARILGARVRDSMDRSVTHVLVADRMEALDVERARAQAKVLHGGRERVHYVSHRWAVSCFRDRKLVPEAVFAR